MSRFGLGPGHWQIVEDLLLKPLAKHGCRGYIFGSRARGDHQKFSDLDVLIEGDLPRIALSDIREALENSNLPIKVDLVLIEDLPDSYRESVFRDRIGA